MRVNTEITYREAVSKFLDASSFDPAEFSLSIEIMGIRHARGTIDEFMDTQSNPPSAVTSNVYVGYRGTGPKGLKQLRPSPEGVYGPGIYFYDNPFDARAYSERYGGILVVLIPVEKAKVHGEVIVAKSAVDCQIVGTIANEATRYLNVIEEAANMILKPYRLASPKLKRKFF